MGKPIDDQARRTCLWVYCRAIATGGGHVGFVVGTDAQSNIMLLGGNQGDMVQISPFKPDRIDGYYWPSRWIDGAPMRSYPADQRYDLPLLSSDGKQVSMT